MMTMVASAPTMTEEDFWNDYIDALVDAQPRFRKRDRRSFSHLADADDRWKEYQSWRARFSQS